MKEEAKLWTEYKEWVKQKNKPYFKKWKKDFDNTIAYRKSEKEKYEKEYKAWWTKRAKAIKKYESLSWWQKQSMSSPYESWEFNRMRAPRDYSYLISWPIFISPYSESQEGFMNWLSEVKYAK